MLKRVLIVDDEENIRETTRLALEAVGYEVGEAGSGLEAFAVIGASESWGRGVEHEALAKAARKEAGK